MVAKKKGTSSRIRRLLGETINDRDLAEVFEAAVLAGDQAAAGKASNEASERSAWGILDRKKFPVSVATLEAWQALKSKAIPRDFDFVSPEHVAERRKVEQRFNRALAKVENELAAISAGEKRSNADDWHRLTRGAWNVAHELRGYDQQTSLEAHMMLQALESQHAAAEDAGQEIRANEARRLEATARDAKRAEYARDPALAQYRAEVNRTFEQSQPTTRSTIAELARVLGPKGRR